MPVSHTNRRKKVYYLHSGTTKTGKPRYWFSQSDEGDLVETVPEGYEVYENPEAQVFLRKIVPRLITPEEVAAVEDGLRRYAPGQNCRVDVKKQYIVIYHSEGIDLDFARLGFGFSVQPVYSSRYMKVMRFTLLNEKTRRFGAERWCFLGSIDTWFPLPSSGTDGKLPALVKRFAPHIGQQSFFELM